MANDWFWARDGKQHGPVGPGEIRLLASSGQLRPKDLVWKEGLADWAEARKIKGLFPSEPPSLAGESSPTTNVQFDSPAIQGGSPSPLPFAVTTPTSVSDPVLTGCCPKCGKSVWKSHLGCLVVFFIIVLFPIGLLLLLLPRRWECATCHYSYSSRDRPFGFKGSALDV